MLNIDAILINEYQIALDKIQPKNFQNLQAYQNACLDLGVKMSASHKKIASNFINFQLANLIAVNSRKIKTNMQIAQAVWDLNSMNYN